MRPVSSLHNRIRGCTGFDSSDEPLGGSGPRSAAPDPIEFAKASEEAGFDGVTCSDHYWLRSVFPHVWVTLSAMACATERVTLAPSFANNLFRSPFEFAQASTAMQRVSNGRYEAGLGAGWTALEMEATGQVFPDGRTGPGSTARRS